MAQKVLANFQEQINSAIFNRMHWKRAERGAYCGFNVFSPDAGQLTFDLGHTGFTAVDDDGEYTDPLGIVVTKQGIIIQEDADITGLTCLTNGSNGSDRYDAVVVNHTKVNTPGGAAATYSIKKGANSYPYENLVVGLTEDEILIGWVVVPANATDLDAASYYPVRACGIANSVNNSTFSAGGGGVSTLDVVDSAATPGSHIIVTDLRTNVTDYSIPKVTYQTSPFVGFKLEWGTGAATSGSFRYTIIYKRDYFNHI